MIDDALDYLRAMGGYLGARGYTLTTARSGAESLALLANAAEFDLIISDLSMPGLSGLELIRRLKELDPEVPIIVVSGYGGAEMSIDALRAGASDYLTKPVSELELDTVVARTLEHVRLRSTRLLYEASQIIFGAHAPGQLPRRLLEAAMKLVRADDASLLLPGPDGKLRVSCSCGLPIDIQQNVQLAIGERVAGRVASSGLPALIVGSLAHDPQFGDIPGYNRVSSSIVYPLRSGDRLVGVLNLNRVVSERPFRSSDLERLAILAPQILLALENDRLVTGLIASERLAAIGELAAGVAHEINTPIQYVGDSVYFLQQAFESLLTLSTAYRGYVSATRGNVDPTLLEPIERAESAARLDYLERQVPRATTRIGEGVDRVAAIVKALRDCARSDRADKAPADINQALLSTLTIVRNQIQGVADVVVDLGCLPLVRCHIGELNQVFVNILVNAGHAIEDSLAGGDGRGTIRVGTRSDGEYVEISVCDSGCGIPEAIAQRVFEPFVTTKRGGRGTGLGLSIARGIVVDKHGGTLTFDSTIGKGTTFYVRLPVRDSADVAPQPSHAVLEARR